MGPLSQAGPIVSRFTWWLAARVARLAEPRSADALLGDLCESGANGFEALTAVAGVVRRAWLLAATALLASACAGWALGRPTAAYVRGTSIYAWLYVDQWTSGHIASVAARQELMTHGFRFFVGGLVLAVAAGVGGLVAGRSQRRWGGTALWVFLACSGLSLADGLRTVSSLNAVVFAQAPYRFGLPALVQVWLVVVAALAWGHARKTLNSSSQPSSSSSRDVEIQP